MLLRKDSIIFNHSWVSSCTMGILKSQWLHPTDPTRCLFIAQSKNSLFSNPCPYNPIFNYYICLLYNTFIYIHDIWIPIYIYYSISLYTYHFIYFHPPNTYIYIYIIYWLISPCQALGARETNSEVPIGSAFRTSFFQGIPRRFCARRGSYA